MTDKKILEVSVMGSLKEVRDFFADRNKVKVEKNEDGSITLRPAQLNRAEKIQLARKVIRNSDYYGYPDHYYSPKFVEAGCVTLCYFNRHDGRYRTGVSICAPEDSYNRDIGRAIAYERAKYGKVKTIDLL